jgi:hypothetical protein
MHINYLYLPRTWFSIVLLMKNRTNLTSADCQDVKGSANTWFASSIACIMCYVAYQLARNVLGVSHYSVLWTPSTMDASRGLGCETSVDHSAKPNFRCGPQRQIIGHSDTLLKSCGIFKSIVKQRLLHKQYDPRSTVHTQCWERLQVVKIMMPAGWATTDNHFRIRILREFVDNAIRIFNKISCLLGAWWEEKIS